MEVQIQHKPSFACIFMNLKPGEKVTAEGNAMASMSANVAFETHMMGGFFSALIRRIFGGESLFVNDFSLQNGESGELVLTQNVPGDIIELELKGNHIFTQTGAFIACTGDIEMKTRWAGFKSWWAGEGFFRMELFGNGKIWLGAFGGVIEKEVKGEYLVDTGYLVAYEPQMQIHIQKAGDSLLSSFFSGEGFVTRMEGNGKIYMQTRTLKGIASWINPRLY